MIADDRDMKLSGNYRGKVISNSDPLKQGRIQVKIHRVFDGVTDAHLPWAVPAHPLFSGAGSNYGWFAVPEVGSFVWCFFEAGDFNAPVYWAEAGTGVHGHPTESDTNYPARRGLKTKGGHIIFIDDQADEIQVFHSSGANISITDSLLKLFKSSATIQIDSSGNITITGTKVDINP